MGKADIAPLSRCCQWRPPCPCPEKAWRCPGIEGIKCGKPIGKKMIRKPRQHGKITLTYHVCVCLFKGNIAGFNVLTTIVRTWSLNTIVIWWENSNDIMLRKTNQHDIWMCLKMPGLTPYVCPGVPYWQTHLSIVCSSSNSRPFTAE